MWLSRVTGNEGLIPEREPERSLPHLRMAAGAKITQFQMEEVVNSRSDQNLYLRSQGWDFKNLNFSLEGKSGASSRGNSSSDNVCQNCCGWKVRSFDEHTISELRNDLSKIKSIV